MASNSGSNSGGAFLSTMSGHQQYFMQHRWHDEAIDLHNAIKLENASALDQDLLLRLQETERKKFTTPFQSFCQFSKSSFEDKKQARETMDDTAKSPWKDIAAAERKTAKRECAHIMSEIQSQEDNVDEVALHLPLGLGDAEHPLLANNMLCEPCLDKQIFDFRFGGSADGLDSAAITKGLYEWACGLDKDAPVDEQLGDTTPVYCHSCEQKGVCKAMVTGSWARFLLAVDSLQHFFRGYKRATLQDASKLVAFCARNTAGNVHRFRFVLLTDADDVPKFIVFGMQLPIRLAFKDKVFPDGSPQNLHSSLKLDLRTSFVDHQPSRNGTLICFILFRSLT